MKVLHNFEVAHLKKKNKEKYLDILQLSSLVLLQCFSMPLGMPFTVKTLEDQQYIVIKAYI